MSRWRRRYGICPRLKHGCADFPARYRQADCRCQWRRSDRTGRYTAFNYFIDTYDVDGDGDESEVQYMDYANTGVMEMDCLLCHMPGYDYLKRTELLRDGKIDATRSVASGLAEENSVAWDDANATAPSGYGTMVTYDNSKFIVTTANNLRLSEAWMHNNISARPDSTNCAFCHFNKPAVDWKKRGDNWAPNGQGDYTYEVHQNIGCMGCHGRKPTAAQGEDYTSVYGGPYPAMGLGLLGHDPAKGSAPFSSLYNNNDFAAFKTCADCHLKQGDGGADYGAPNPEAAHREAGLEAKIVQATDSVAGKASISHIDMMACSACHSRKVDSYDWNGMGTGNNGNPMVDATGNDVEGRLTDHENANIIKTDMTDRSGLGWYQGKLLRTSYLNTLFWRDKNDTPELDANMDGRPHGMDALLMTQVNKVNEENNWTSLTEDKHGHVTAADINERVGKLKTEIESWTGQTNAKIKLSMMHVAFKDQHGVSPAAMAWGSGAGNNPSDPADDNTNGCLDCHQASANFYNGAVDTVGDNNSMYWDDDVVPFTKVNGFSQATDMHPNVKDKFGVRSLASRVTTGTINVGGIDYATHVDLPRAATMYEATFMGPADFAPSYSSTAAIDFSGFEKGWLLMVQARNISTQVVTTRTKAVGVGGGAADVANVGELIASLGINMTDAAEFTVTADGAGTGITITAKAGYEVKLAGGVDSSGAFKLSNAAYKLKPWTGTDGGTYNGRAEWVNYLNAIDTSDLTTFGIGVDPQASIASINGGNSVMVGDTVQFVADQSLNTQGSFTYSWSCEDGGAAATTDAAGVGTKTFDSAGSFTVLLKVTDEEGKVAVAQQQVVVNAPLPPADIALIDADTVRFNNLPTPNSMLYIQWGDGGAQLVTGISSVTTHDVDHVYPQTAAYDRGDYYEYYVQVSVYNGWSYIGNKTGYVRIYK